MRLTFRCRNIKFLFAIFHLTVIAGRRGRGLEGTEEGDGGHCAAHHCKTLSGRLYCQLLAMLNCHRSIMIFWQFLINGITGCNPDRFL
jgi:hypothetical protein